MSDKIVFKLDGKDVAAGPGETIWDVAKREGTKIPHLCHVDLPGYRVDGNCRACMVDVKGERVLDGVVHPQTDGGHGGADAIAARREVARDGVRAAREQHAAARAGAGQSGAVLAMGRVDGHRRQRALCLEVRAASTSTATKRPPSTFRIPRSP